MTYWSIPFIGIEVLVKVDAFFLQRSQVEIIFPQSDSYAHESCNIVIELLGIGF